MSPELAGSRGAHDPGPGERLDVEGVQPGQDREVVVDDRIALGLGNPNEIRLSAGPVGDESAWVVDPAVDVRHRDAVLFEQLLAQHLVLERECAREVEPVAAHVQLERFRRHVRRR